MPTRRKRRGVSIEIKLEFAGKPEPVQITFDTSVGAFYVRVEKGTVARTIELQDGVFADLDRSCRLLGVEFLRPAEVRDLDRIAESYKVQGRRARDAVKEASRGVAERLLVG